MKRLAWCCAWPGLAWAEGGAGAPLDTAAYAFKTLLALLVVVALVVAGAWALRRLQALGGGAHGGLRIVAALSVGSRERLLVVQVGEEQLLIGVAPGQVRTLHVLPRPLPPGEGAFGERLGRALRRQEEADDR